MWLKSNNCGEIIWVFLILVTSATTHSPLQVVKSLALSSNSSLPTNPKLSSPSPAFLSSPLPPALLMSASDALPSFFKPSSMPSFKTPSNRHQYRLDEETDSPEDTGLYSYRMPDSNPWSRSSSPSHYSLSEISSPKHADLSSRLDVVEKALRQSRLERHRQAQRSSPHFGDLSKGTRTRHVFPPLSYGVHSSIRREEAPLEITHELPAIIESHRDQMPAGTLIERQGEEGCHKSYECSRPNIIYKITTKKAEPQIIYKVKKVYVPKPYAVIKKIHVVKTVPKVVYKNKIKIKTVVKKVPVIKKIKIPVPIKVKYIKVKKIKVPVIKKIKVPIIRKVVKFIPQTKHVKHVHMHRIYIKDKADKKKKTKFKLAKKIKNGMAKMLKKKMLDPCTTSRSDGCPYPPCPVPMPVSPGLSGLMGRRRKRSTSRYPDHVMKNNQTDSIGKNAFANESLWSNESKLTPSPVVLSKRIGWFRKVGEDCDDSMKLNPLASYFGRFRQSSDSPEDAGEGISLDGSEDEESDVSEMDEYNRKRRRRKRRAIDRSITLGPRIQGYFFSDRGWSGYGSTIRFEAMPEISPKGYERISSTSKDRIRLLFSSRVTN